MKRFDRETKAWILLLCMVLMWSPQIAVVAAQVVSVALGGTGATTAAGARTNLSAAASGANSDITSANSMTSASTLATVGTITSGTWSGTTVALNKGGTGSTTASGARSNLGASASGANGDITSLTASTSFTSNPGNANAAWTMGNNNAGSGSSTWYTSLIDNGQVIQAYLGDASQIFNAGGLTIGNMGMCYNAGKKLAFGGVNSTDGPQIVLDTTGVVLQNFNNVVTATIKGISSAQSSNLLNINQSGSTILFAYQTAVSAVNGITFTGAATAGTPTIAAGGSSSDTNVALIVSGKGTSATASNVQIGVLGTGLAIKGGSNAKIGTATLVGGTVTVSTTAVTANSRIFVQETTLGTVAIPSALAVTTITAGTSFVVTASAATDTSTIHWMIAEQNLVFPFPIILLLFSLFFGRRKRLTFERQAA